MSRAYYSSNIAEFLQEEVDDVLGKIVSQYPHDVELAQRNAWKEEICILKSQLINFKDAHLFLEFSIPRMGKRADSILLLNGVVYVLEFKVGAKEYFRSGKDQATDYALDLSNFHETSQSRLIVPILIATCAESVENSFESLVQGVHSCLCSNAIRLGDLLADCRGKFCFNELDPMQWEQGRYRPTPTIIEAARALYQNHDVKEISRSEAGASNLSSTENCLKEIILLSKNNMKKSICFVTGVPGSGKTLAGLNIACSRQQVAKDEHAVFLSGNGPLVEVLREALARDAVKISGSSKREARSKTDVFIQNVHHFRDEGLALSDAPTERVVVFDEAQRAWNREHLGRFMLEKKGIQGFPYSEPEFLISVMDRILDWCTVVCLVGGGQEINDGEAGLTEWVLALKRFKHWQVFASPQLGRGEYATEFNQNVSLESRTIKDELHLKVSLRSFRAESLNSFIECLLEGNSNCAAKELDRIQSSYPIYFTRNFEIAKEWLRCRARGNELKGLLASSGGIRLKADGIIDICINNAIMDAQGGKSLCVHAVPLT